MIRNTDTKTWYGLWYLPDCETKHHGVLEYGPEEGFRLKIMSEGFESPWIEIDRPTKVFQPPSKGGVYGFRDVSKPYPAVYGEVDGKLVTLFDVFNGGGSLKHGSQAPYSYAIYYPQIMAIGAHIPSKKSEVLRSINVSVDFLHVWLPDTGRLQVGMKRSAESTLGGAEYFAQFETGLYDRPLRGVTLDDGTSVTVASYGTLPGLNWSAYGYESRSTSSAAVKFTGAEGSRSLDSFESKILALDTLISVCLDRHCKPNAFECDVQVGDSNHPVDLLIPRRGPVPTAEATGEYVNGLAFCDDNRGFNHYFERWFPFYEKHSPALSLLNGLLNENGDRYLEPSVMMAQTLLEAFHKSVYGEKISSLLPISIETSERWSPSRSAREEHKVTPFKRAIDLYHRMPEDVRHSLIPNAEKWARGLVDARNDITHEGGLQRVNPLQANTAATLTVAAVTVHVLMYLGVEDKLILRSLNGHTSLSKARNFANDYLK